MAAADDFDVGLLPLAAADIQALEATTRDEKRVERVSSADETCAMMAMMPRGSGVFDLSKVFGAGGAESRGGKEGSEGGRVARGVRLGSSPIGSPLLMTFKSAGSQVASTENGLLKSQVEQAVRDIQARVTTEHARLQAEADRAIAQLRTEHKRFNPGTKGHTSPSNAVVHVEFVAPRTPGLIRTASIMPKSSDKKKTVAMIGQALSDSDMRKRLSSHADSTPLWDAALCASGVNISKDGRVVTGVAGAMLEADAIAAHRCVKGSIQTWRVVIRWPRLATHGKSGVGVLVGVWEPERQRKRRATASAATYGVSLDGDTAYAPMRPARGNSTSIRIININSAIAVQCDLRLDYDAGIVDMVASPVTQGGYSAATRHLHSWHVPTDGVELRPWVCLGCKGQTASFEPVPFRGFTVPEPL